MPEETISVYKKEKGGSFPIIPFLLLILIAGELAFLYFNPPSLRKPEVVEQTAPFEIYSGIGYKALDENKYGIDLFASNIPSLSSIIISPDDKYMLASSLTGEVIAFVRQGDTFVRQATEFFSLENIADGLPEEMGLTGVAFAADFDISRELFLFYSKRDGEGKLFNHVGKIAVEEKNGIIAGANFNEIFTANTEGNVSHQIQKGTSIMVEGESHVLFAIGEGFKAEQSLDETLESGKLMLIQSDGSDPLGPRPFPDHKKIQAIGVRNAPIVTFDSYDTEGRFIVVDTGPEKYDRFIYSNLLNLGKDSIKPISFNWDGSEESLAEALPDPNLTGVADMVLHRWNPTMTVTNAEIHTGKGAIPVSDNESTSMILIYFGLTADATTTRGKQLILATVNRTSSLPALTLEPIVERSAEASNFTGNPIGLAIEKSGTFYFGDIIEGRIYKVTIK